MTDTKLLNLQGSETATYIHTLQVENDNSTTPCICLCVCLYLPIDKCEALEGGWYYLYMPRYKCEHMNSSNVSPSHCRRFHLHSPSQRRGFQLDAVLPSLMCLNSTA